MYILNYQECLLLLCFRPPVSRTQHAALRGYSGFERSSCNHRSIYAQSLMSLGMYVHVCNGASNCHVAIAINGPPHSVLYWVYLRGTGNYHVTHARGDASPYTSQSYIILSNSQGAPCSFLLAGKRLYRPRWPHSFTGIRRPTCQRILTGPLFPWVLQNLQTYCIVWRHQPTRHPKHGPYNLPLREARHTSPILPRRVSNPGPPIDDPRTLPLLQVRWIGPWA